MVVLKTNRKQYIYLNSAKLNVLKKTVTFSSFSASNNFLLFDGYYSVKRCQPKFSKCGETEVEDN